jgi:S-adenosylmethionine synthetase
MRTAEAVSKGHPDKICDQISDAILDDILKQDPDARVAIETMGGHGIITLTGEVTTTAYCDMASIAKKVYKDIGYKDEVGVQVNVVTQSPDISQGVDTGGAGDQGIMVGYACNDNEEMIPQELYLARKLLDLVLKNKDLGPDAKSQITLNEDKISRIVLSVQHREDTKLDEIKETLYNILDTWGYEKSDDCQVIVNGTGKFVVGGFTADTGVTGRKIVQDAYGPQVQVGGGAFSGKDPSKVDRSAAYMARYLAVQILKEEPHASEATVKIAYSIGVARPLMVSVELKDSTGWTKAEEEYLDNFLESYDLTPQGIIKFLDLKKPIYQITSENGHFGHGFNWDK